MPRVLLDRRFPLPSLWTYTSLSVLFFSISLFYALRVTSEPGWVLNATDSSVTAQELEANMEPVDSIRVLLQKMFLNNQVFKRFYELSYVISEDQFFVWTLVNMAYCVMLLLGKCIQKLVFGKLRVIEEQHMKDKFWNFVFYKFIFIFGVMNAQYMDEVLMWCGWFSFVGAFHLLSTLCKDRFEYLSFSPTTSKWTHVRLFSLLFFILSVSIGLCVFVGKYAGMNIFFFMASEWTLVILRTFYVLVRYGIHLYDVTHEGVWEKRGVFTYYSELCFDLATLVVDFVHHLHMLLWRNIFLSVASLVICMQLRCLIHEIQHKVIRHKNYLQVSRHMENNFPLATKEEIEANSDDCAICWDRMESARKLPCGHMFHTSCLHSWLEQVTNCPTCRTALVPKDNPSDPRSDVNRNILGQENQGRGVNQTTNHFFHFDGSRYVSWLPSFSVEVSRTNLLGERTPHIMLPRTSQLDIMVAQVQQMFPHMPYHMILTDVLTSGSVERTVENILEERLVAPRRANSSTSSSTHTTPLVGSSPESLQENSNDAPDVRANEMTGVSGSRFSKNSQEREGMLFSRKEELIRKARSKYISRINVRPGEPSSSSN